MESKTGITESKYKAPALTKGLEIIEFLATSGQGYTAIALAKELNRSPSEIFRMLFVLRERGYIDLGADDHYRLTTKLFEVAHRYPPIKRLTAIAGEYLQDCATLTNQSVHLAILNGGNVLIISQVDCPSNTITTVRLGAQFPIVNSASGRVLAIGHSDNDLSDLIALDRDASDKNRQDFLADIKHVRKLGYCEGESFLIRGIINLSAPVFDHTGAIIAAVTIPFISRLNGTETMNVTKTREILVETCRQLSQKMGAGVTEEKIRV